MTPSQSLVLYRPSSSTSSASVTTTSPNRTLISSRLFTATTGTAIATELLYRILIEIINRLLHSFQNFASARLDQLSSFLERKSLEREEERKRRADASASSKKGDGKGLGILEEVERLNEDRGGFACPMGGEHGGYGGRRNPPAPPRWVRVVLKGVEEGRMQKRDFWINTLGD